MLEPWLETTETIVQTLTLAFGAYVAAAGLSTWKRQLRGKTEYDLARRLMRAVLRVRDAVGVFRSPFISVHEMQQARHEAGLEALSTNMPGDARTTGLVYQRRWASVAKAQSDLQVEVLEAEVLWKEEAPRAQLQLHRATQALYAAMVMLYAYPDRGGPKGEKLRLSQEEWFRALNAGAADPDTHEEAIEAAVRSFDELVQRHLRK